MHRIDTPTAQPDKFGPGKNGFTGGNPQTGQLPTALDEDFFDAVQESVARVIEDAGIALVKGDHDQLLQALGKSFLKAGNAFSEIKDAGPDAVALALENLGLGEAAKRDVGTGENQVPDMSSFNFKYIDDNTAVFTFPNGLIVQAGNLPISGQSATLTFPVPFPIRVLAVAGLNFNSSVNIPSLIASYAIYWSSAWEGSGRVNVNVGATQDNKAFRYIAIGY